MFRNSITSVGLASLFDMLKQCNIQLQKLNLYQNKLGDSSIKSLGEYLESNQSLTSLDISHNQITDKGVEELAEYLVGNITLKNLNLSLNVGITDASVPSLIQIGKKTHLSRIFFFGCSLSSDKSIEIDNVLNISVDSRETPILSTTKSAAKCA